MVANSTTVGNRSRKRSGHYHEQRNRWTRERKYLTLVSPSKGLLGRRTNWGTRSDTAGRRLRTGRLNRGGWWWWSRYSTTTRTK